MPMWSDLYLQDSASPFMKQLTEFHDYTMMIIIVILTMVAINILSILLVKLTNRSLMQQNVTEIIWTFWPTIVLLLIALPSLSTLYLMDTGFINSSLNLKVVGHQWYWSYEYSDFPGLEFDSYMTPLTQTSSFRLLDVDNNLILPYNTNISLIVTAADVIHAWTVPALGIKVDAIPGRLNFLNFMIDRLGMFYGQCSELCGANHSFMPIKIESVPMQYFLKWINLNH